MPDKTLRRRFLRQDGDLNLYQILDEQDRTACHHLVRGQAVRVCYEGEDVAKQELRAGIGPRTRRSKNGED